MSVTADKAKVSLNIDEARAGDAEAQYAVGDALCCSGDAAEGTVYNTTEALTWLCRAAEQGNTDAMVKLGDIFSGDQVDGLRMMRRVLTAVSGTPKNLPAAYYWYTRAEAAGLSEAAEMTKPLDQSMTAADRTQAAHYLAASTTPCSWSDLQTAAVDESTTGPKPKEVR
ncbi:MAG: hypothetical protein AAFP68_12910 [Pseudomonadota bacterium]